MGTTHRENWVVRWAATHIGGSVGEWLSDGTWESDGFLTEDDTPYADHNGNTLSNHSETPFDPEDEDHVKLACSLATSNGCRDRSELHEFLVGTLGIDSRSVDSQLESYLEC